MRYVLGLFFWFGGVLSVIAQEGLYADFVTTQGNFTCQLYFDQTPQTVANFVALATGERAWLDSPTGSVRRTHFYDGLTFHRVLNNFVIQGGSPAGDGSDGPGYQFRDEFVGGLSHDRAGILSMANAGPNSNGSQFFITLAAAPDALDGRHTIFGEVTSGLDVVQAIGAVPVDENGRPLTPVAMQSVAIRRVGAAALAFDVQAQGLPSVGGAGPDIEKDTDSTVLQFPRELYSEYWLYDSFDLETWNQTYIDLYIDPPPTEALDVTETTIGQSRHFYRVPQIAYPGPIYTPPSVWSKTLRFEIANGPTLILAFNATGGGTLERLDNNTTGDITDASWTQDAYRGTLLVFSTNLFPLLVYCVFDTRESGAISGTAYADNPFDFSGTFTLSTPAP